MGNPEHYGMPFLGITHARLRAAQEALPVLTQMKKAQQEFGANASDGSHLSFGLVDHNVMVIKAAISGLFGLHNFTSFALDLADAGPWEGHLGNSLTAAAAFSRNL
jgi:hypothetical protein